MSAASKKLAAVSALAMLGMSMAHASITAPTVAGGSEAVLTIVNTANNATITQDLGKTMSQIAPGSLYALSTASQNFITSAGGLSSVTFAVIAGSTTTRTYMTTSADTELKSVEIANSERNVWAGTLNQLTGAYNSGDPSATTVNNTYGQFLTGDSGNYLDAGWDIWNGGYVTNTGAGDTDLLLYSVVYGTNNGLNAAIEWFFGVNGQSDSFARLSLTTLQIGQFSAVPLPAAAWLFGSGLGLLGVIRRNARR